MTNVTKSIRVTSDKKEDRQAVAWLVDIDFMSNEDITNEDVESALEEAIENLGDSK